MYTFYTHQSANWQRIPLYHMAYMHIHRLYSMCNSNKYENKFQNRHRRMLRPVPSFPTENTHVKGTNCVHGYMSRPITLKTSSNGDNNPTPHTSYMNCSYSDNFPPPPPPSPVRLLSVAINVVQHNNAHDNYPTVDQRLREISKRCAAIQARCYMRLRTLQETDVHKYCVDVL